MSQPLALIIDDNYGIAHIFSTILQREAYDTEIFLDGLSAAERLTAVQPALVILDMHLPHLSGEQILTQIRADPRLSKTRVIIVTASVQSTRFIQAKPDTVLSKPLQLEQIRHIAARFYPHPACSM